VIDGRTTEGARTAYIDGFSPSARDIFERFESSVQIDRLEKAKLLYTRNGKVLEHGPAPARRQQRADRGSCSRS
jgi:hypothetical protein